MTDGRTHASDGPLQERLIERGRNVVALVHRYLAKLRHSDEWRRLRTAFDNGQQEQRLAATALGRRHKDTTFADFITEHTAREELDNPSHGLPLKAIGEELMKTPEWLGLERLDLDKTVVALIDPVDGTKLEAHDIPNWCTAIVFFERATGTVLASMVGQATGALYFATAAALRLSPDQRESRAWRRLPDPNRPYVDGWLRYVDPEPLDLSSSMSSRENAHVAFVAQNPHAFLYASRFVAAALRSGDHGLARLYNLGGNPMLAKVADGTIDAVVGFGDVNEQGPRPQMPHDFVPGAFIARQAGAAVLDLETGEDLDFSASLLRPDARARRYVVAHRRVAAERYRGFVGALS